jgi:hypothetical protein
VGWGECISQFRESSLATKTIIEEGFVPLLVGDDALDVERLWHKMLGRIWWYGPEGIAAFSYLEAPSKIPLAKAGKKAKRRRSWSLQGVVFTHP